MNKKIITTGKAVLSTVMASTMVCSMLPMNIYAQGTEEPVIVEENNVSDPNQEKEDEPQASEQEQPEEETVQSEESVDNNVQNTEPQSEEETVETEQTQSTLGARATAPDVVFDVGEEYEKVNIVNPTADSVETSGENGAVANAFDGNQQTVWHTLWSSDGQKQMPHWISYELAEPTTIGRIDYVGKPGQNGVGNGVFKSVNIYVSTNAGQDPSTNEGWTKVGTYNGITYNPSTGVDTNRSHTFTFTPTLAAKVKIEITESYSSGSGTEPENQYANALELITYAYKAQPEDTLPITVSIDGKSYTGDSIQAIVEDNSISKNNVKKFSITGGTIEYADLEYLGNGSSFLFREIKELTIDLTKATMLNEAGEKTTELPSSIFGSMKKLEKLSLPGVTKIGAGVFKQAGNNNGITSLNLPDVVELGTNAFDGAAFKLREINLPKAQIIGQSAMRGNYKYSNVVFHLDSVVRIGDNAFDNTSRHTPYIQELTLPETLEELGHNCFLIKEDGTITLEGETSPKTPEVSGWYPFGDENFTLKVPNDSYKAEDFGKEGQVTLIPAKVSDTEVPEVKVTYSNKNGSQVTKEDVTVTLTANEDIQDIEGWTRVDSKTLQKVHSENGKFNVTVKDLAGNETKVKYEVKRIDKVAPVIEGVKDGEVTNKDVEFTVKEQSISKIIIDEKEYNEKNAPKKVSGEGKHTIKVVDKAGNETSVSFTIDQTAPKFTVKEESKGYDGVYSKLSLKLYDAHKVDYVEINGKKKDLSDNQWSDLNDQNAGYKEGKNTVVLYDVAGNSAEFTFIYDKTGPTVTVKDSSVEKDGYYSRLDLKLYDANNVDYAEINGKRFELTNNQWSDINHANAGYVDGENTIVVYDQAGNSTTVKFMIGEPVKADKTALQEKIDEAKKLEEDNYTEETWSKLEEVLEAAEKVNDNEKATQEEVDKAVADLDAAIKGLEEVVINITANVNGTPVSGETLEDAVTKAGIEQDDVDTVELLTGTITQADLDYLKGSRVTELTINLDADLKMADGSTKMPGSQFQNSRLEKLTLGGFTEIGSRAFVQSTSLKEVSLPDVVTVGKEAFYRCDDYTDVTLPASIQSIGDSAFAEAANGKRELNVVFQGTTPPELGNRPFGSLGTVTVPEGSLTAYLPELDITKTFRDSGTNKFGNLDVIDPAYQKVKFQYGQYGSNAFYAYYKKGAALNTVEIQDIPSSSIPEGKEFAGWNTKKDGSGATIADTDAVPADVEVLYPVYEDVVVNITINIDGKEISGETLQAAVEEAGLTTGLINKVEFVSGKVTKADLEYIAKYADELIFKLSDTLTYVGDNDTATTVFPNTSQNWSQLESLTLEGFTEIAASAFYNHEDLRTVNLTGVEIIGGSAFNVSKNASKKEMNVTISDSIKEIGSKAFYGQNNRPLNLTLNVKDPSTITLNKNAFDGINTSLSKVNVPEGSLQNYLTNLDITKAFNSSTNTKWNKMIVNDPAYQLMTFQYDADYEGVTFNAYIKNGSTLSSISLEDVQTAINNRIPEGYAFAGWNTAVDGTGTDITDETVFPIEAERIYIKLAVAADKTKLQEQIDAAKDLKEEDYVASTWADLETALEEANKVNEDVSASQDEVDKAAEALKAAIENLVKAGKSEAVSIVDNGDGTLTLTLDRKTQKSSMSGSSEGGTWVLNEDGKSLTSNQISAGGSKHIDVVVTDMDGKQTHHAIYRDDEGKWKIIASYRFNDKTIAKPVATLEADGQTYTFDGSEVHNVTVDSVEGTPILKVSGTLINYVSVQLTGQGENSKVWNEEDIPGDRSYIEIPLVSLKTGKPKAGKYSIYLGSDGLQARNVINLTIKKVVEVNKDDLQKQIDAAKKLEESSYTEETWSKLEEALKAAEEVNADQTATQDEVDKAASDLEAAIKGLELFEPADKTALQKQIEEAEDRNENYYTADTWTKLQEALTSAKAVNDNDSASQTEVDEATSALEAALKALVYEVEGEIYLVIGDEKIPLINLTNTADQSYWEDPYVYDKPLSSNPMIRIEGKDIYEVTVRKDGSSSFSTWKGNASDHVSVKEWDLFNSSNNGNGTYKLTVGVDKKIFRIAIEVTNYTSPSTEALKAALDKAKAIEKGNYTDESFEALQEAIKKSDSTYNAAVKNLWDADQAELDNATKRVEDAIAALEVNSTDKTKLQSLVDEVKDYNAEGVTGFDVFQDQLKLAQDALADPEATQEDIDKRVIQLEGRYYIVQLKALNAKYKDTISGKSSVIYTTDSMKALVEMYEGVKDKSFSASKVLKQTDVDTAKAKLEEYQKLEKELVKASASDATVGINESALARSANKGQGTFEILSKTAVEGGYELTIKFTNDAMHPIYGESYTNYDGDETKFAKFGGTANAKMYVDAYDSSFGAISRPWTSNTSFEVLEGNTSKTPGFTTKITVPENTAYVTLSYTYSGATAHSAGYWVVGNIQEVVEVDKTALKEAIDEADAALQLVKSDEVTVSDGETQMDKIFPDARELYENPDATQEQVDQMTEDLVAATQYMKEHETWIEILSVGSVENNSISLICNNIPYKTLDGKHKGVALFGDYAKGEAGTNSSLKWDRTRDGSTDYTVINNLEDGENFFYIRFKGYFADEYQDTYWVYVNTTTKEADFGKVGDAVDPSAVVKAGDQDISVSDKEQTISVQDGEKAKLVVTGEDIGYATVTKDGKVVEQTLFPLLNHKTLEVDASEAGEYQVKVVYNWNRYKVSGGNGVYVYDKEVTYNFTIEEAPDVNKTELQSLYDEVKGKTSENSFFKYFSETLEESKNVLEDPDATQEEIDKQVIKLNTRYYGLLVGELNDEYNPEKKDYSLYSTESVVPVANIWQITRYRVNNNYQESETQGNIGQMKGWYEQYLEAIEGLTSADDTSLKVGINKDALRTSEDQGHFEVVSKSPTSDGKYEVTVHFINDGIHPIYGEELPNASGSTEFDKMSLSNSSKVRIRTFKEGFASYQTKYASEVGKLPGQTSISKGLEAKFILDADEVYFTLEAVEGRNSSFSEGYFVVKNIVEEEVEPADKTALGEAVESARLALAAVDLKQTTVTDGYDELKELYTKALTLSEDENATQKEVDAMVKELTDAEAYMQSNEAQREMLEIVSQDESTLTFKTNYFPFGVYAYHVDSGQSKTITFTQSKADSTVTAHGLKEGENFFYLQFTNRWTKSQNMYWVYVDTTKNVSDFGKLTDAVQSDLVAIVHVGDKDYPVKTTSASQTIIEVPKGTDEVTVTIQGVDLGYAEVKNKDEGIPQERIYPPYDSDHKSITFKLTDSEGNLAEGPYQALIKYNFRAWEPVTGQTLYKTTAYREFTIKFVEPSTDKTELQSFYDKVKDLQSDVSSFKYFTTQLKAAKNVLDNPQATQDEIDLAIINLEAKYYAVKVAELNVKYNPENDFNFTEYTTESLVPVMNMWGITHNRSNGNYFEDSERGDVGQMKGWYEEYTKAIEGLKEATDESVYIGITSESTKSDDEQGSFEVVSAEKVIVDGQEKVKLVVNYNNTGIHPIYGESLLNANGTKKFRKITSMSEKISFRYEAYNSEMKHQISAGMSDKTKLPDATNWSAGMQGVCYLDPSINYVTFVINNELYSSWIYRIPELSSPVDKSDLQSLIEETKNYQSDDSYYDEFQEALTNAQNVLSNEEATQEEVDEAHENLELYYYRSHAYALALKYKPVGAASGKYDGTFDYAKYEVEGALKVINAYYGVMNLGAYPKVADVKTAYEILKAAIPELKEITGEPRSMLVGPNEDLIELTESRGYFTFEESPAENGMINLHIVYVNNGINPINGKDFGEFEGRKFTALKSTLRLQCQTYKGAGKIIDFKDDITLMGGNEATSVDGFEVDVVVEPGRYNVYMELEGVEVYSQGYYYTSESAATGSETSAAKDEVSSDENQSVDSSQETEESTNPFLSFLDSIIQFFKDLF